MIAICLLYDCNTPHDARLLANSSWHAQVDVHSRPPSPHTHACMHACMHMQVAFQGLSTGYLAFGFSQDDGRMVGSQAVLGFSPSSRARQLQEASGVQSYSLTAKVAVFHRTPFEPQSQPAPLSEGALTLPLHTSPRTSHFIRHLEPPTTCDPLGGLRHGRDSSRRGYAKRCVHRNE